ncbi:MFS transporter, partial [Streptomyces sp. T-3]|nr:MFS transporter [Streptomyces sp. T-3]
VGALLLAPRVLPGTRPAEQRTGLDLPGAGLATGGIVLASYGLVLSDAHGWGSYEVLVPLAAGTALLLAFFAVERRAVAPLLPPRFLLRRRRALGLVAIALTAAGTSTTFVLFSLHLQEARGWSPLATSGAFVPFAVALILSGRLAGPLIGRFGAGRVAGGGLLVGA